MRSLNVSSRRPKEKEESGMMFALRKYIPANAGLSKSPILLKNTFNPEIYMEYRRLKDKENNVLKNTIISEPKFVLESDSES